MHTPASKIDAGAFCAKDSAKIAYDAAVKAVDLGTGITGTSGMKGYISDANFDAGAYRTTVFNNDISDIDALKSDAEAKKRIHTAYYGAQAGDSSLLNNPEYVKELKEAEAQYNEAQTRYNKALNDKDNNNRATTINQLETVQNSLDFESTAKQSRKDNMHRDGSSVLCSLPFSYL